MTAKIIPMITCGGAGTRLWPVSRESMPKQFVPGQGSTFQQVMTRVSDRELFAHPIVITNLEFRLSWLSGCATAASVRISCLSPRAETRVPQWRSPACLHPNAIRNCSRPITSFVSLPSSAMPVGAPPRLRPLAESSRSASIRPMPRPITAISVPERNWRFCARRRSICRKARCGDGCENTLRISISGTAAISFSRLRRCGTRLIDCRGFPISCCPQWGLKPQG
jgi:Nucleotidyl transferase